MNHVGDALRRAREAAGLSQTEAAQRARVNKVSVSRWEGGQRQPSMAALDKLARVYGLSVGAMLDDSQGGNKRVEKEPPAVGAGGLSEFGRGALYAARRMSATVTAILDDVLAQEERASLTPLERQLLATVQATRHDPAPAPEQTTPPARRAPREAAG